MSDDKRFRRVFEYIHQNLDSPLTVQRLAEVAHFSRYHFHRRFSALAGVGVYRYVQLQRLKRAGYRLSFRPWDKVIDIALEAGFENAESFSRAFKKAFGQAPLAFRKAPNWQTWHAQYDQIDNRETQTMQSSTPAFCDVEIVDFPTTPIAAFEHCGPPETVMDSVRTFIGWRKRNALGPNVSSTYNIFYHAPEEVSPQQYRMDICAGVQSAIPANPEGVVNKHIAGGRCARLRHIGADDGLGRHIQWLYRYWLEQSGETVRDSPLFVHRVNLFPDIAESEMICDIYLPLAD